MVRSLQTSKNHLSEEQSQSSLTNRYTYNKKWEPQISSIFIAPNQNAQFQTPFLSTFPCTYCIIEKNNGFQYAITFNYPLNSLNKTFDQILYLEPISRCIITSPMKELAATLSLHNDTTYSIMFLQFQLVLRLIILGLSFSILNYTNYVWELLLS